MQTSTFLMSCPGPRWHIRGAENFRSQGRAPTNPRRAATEWLALADAIEQTGAEVLVLPPADVDPPLTGMIYTANAGALLSSGFLVSRMHVAHRLDEAGPIEDFIRQVGLPTSRAIHTWEGQAEICGLPELRYVLTYGVRSVPESVSEVMAQLPTGARTLSIKLREPFFHGDTCLASIPAPRGPLLLACGEALVDRSLDELGQFARGVEIVPVGEADALAYACNALAVGKKWLVPRGVSAGLCKLVADRGLEPVEMDLGELFGKGGGGPRCLVNVLPSLPGVPEGLTLRGQRKALEARIASYPEAAGG